jgi:hypothetical protein
MTAPQPIPADRTGESESDFGVDRPGRLGASDLHSLFTVEGRLFETEEDTPCRVSTAGDLWFSPFRDRERAARLCWQCPFQGRCGYNAVASRATHGVWGEKFCPVTNLPRSSRSTSAC